MFNSSVRKVSCSILSLMTVMVLAPTAGVAAPPGSEPPPIIIDAGSHSGTELTVNHGETYVIDFSNGSSLNLTGNFSNSGTVYLVSGNKDITSGFLGASNIINGQGALLTSVLPKGGIDGLNGLLNSFSFTLSAVNNITNYGTISSANNLTAIAGGSIQNILPAGGPSPIMQAINNLNLNAANIVNAGTLASTSGNINIASVQNIIINNVGGQMKALEGVINLRDALFNGSSGISILGGDVLSEVLNLHSGSGKIDLNVNDISSLINASGGTATIAAVTENMNLGTITMIGDPTFANTGDLTLTSSLNFNDHLALIAGGSILSDTKSLSISTNGGDLMMVAGANYNAVTGVNGTTIQITGGSASGGSIELSSKDGVTGISSAGANGGDVTLVAYYGAGGGKVNLSGVSVNSSGTAGTAGNILMIAGAPGGTGINVGEVTATGSGGGTVTLASATPAIVGDSSVDVLDGKVVNNGKFATGQTANNSIETKGIHAAGTITATAGLNLEMGGNIVSDGGSIYLTATNGQLDIFDASMVTAHNNIGISGHDAVYINAKSNNTINSVLIQAGVLKPGANTNETLLVGDVLSSGTITIISTDDAIFMGRAVTTRAVGGDVVFAAGTQVNIESDNNIESLGGYVSIYANQQIQVQRDTAIKSVAMYTDLNDPSKWTGGGIGIYNDNSAINIINELKAIQADQANLIPGTDPPIAHLIQDPQFFWENGGYIGIEERDNDAINITGGEFLADGGVISIQTQGGPTGQGEQARKIDIKNSNLTAIAPNTTGGTDGGTTGQTTDGGTTGQTTDGGTTGQTTDGGTTGQTTDGGTTGQTTDGGTTGQTTDGGTTGQTTDGGTTGQTTDGGTTGETTDGGTTGQTTDGGTTGETTDGGTTGETTDGGTTGETTDGGTTGDPEPPSTTGGTTGDTTGGETGGPEENRLSLPGFLSSLLPTDLTPRHIGFPQGIPDCSPIRIGQRNLDRVAEDAEAPGPAMLALSGNSPYAFEGDDETVILATEGTKFAPVGRHGLSLMNGSLTIMTGSKAASVQTKMGTVAVKPMSSVTVSQGRFGSVRVTSLDGQPAAMEVAHRGEVAKVAVNPGQEMSLMEQTVAAAGTSDFAPSPDAVDQAGPVDGLTMNIGGLDLSSETLKQLRNCRHGCMTIGMKKRFDEVMKKSERLASNNRNKASIEPHSAFRPVAMATPIGVQAQGVQGVATDAATIKYNDKSIVTIKPDGAIALAAGTVFIKAAHDTVIDAGECMINVKKGTIVLVTKDKHFTKVRNMYDTARNSISVAVKGKHVKLTAGQELIYGENDRSIWQQMSADAVGRRRVVVTDVAKGEGCVGVCEFSISTLLQNADIIKAMYISADKLDRRFVADVMKMSVCLNHATVGHGSYQAVSSNSH